MVAGDPDDSEPDDGPVLGPDELDIAEDENVLEIDEGRYVISTDEDRPPNPAGIEPDLDEGNPPATEASKEAEPTLTEEDVYTWLDRRFQGVESRYGFDVTAKFDESIHQQRLVSNNVVTVFEHLILWYAEQVGGDTPVEEVLGILLTEATVPIRYPRRTLVALLEYHGLDQTNSIAELLEAIDDNEGVLLPPSERRKSE